MKELIEFNEFIELQKKLEIKVGLILSVEEVPKSKKLIKLLVKFGETESIVLTNIKPLFSDINVLCNQKMLFITNLKPVTMMGIESSAMILPGQIEKNGILTVNSIDGEIVL